MRCRQHLSNLHRSHAGCKKMMSDSIQCRDHRHRSGILHGALAKARRRSGHRDRKKRSKLRLAKQLGADYTININEIDDPVAEVKKLTEAWSRHVLESVGTPETYEQAFNMVEGAAMRPRHMPARSEGMLLSLRIRTRREKGHRIVRRYRK